MNKVFSFFNSNAPKENSPLGANTIRFKGIVFTLDKITGSILNLNEKNYSNKSNHNLLI